MKLSFSTRGWEKLGWQGICQVAEENRFQGIEVYDVDQNVFQGDEAPFADGRAASTVRKLNERGLSVALVACPVNLADAEKINENIARVRRYIDVARRLKTPYVRVYAEGEADEKAIGSVCSVIGNVLEEAYRAGIAILIETTGIFADTARLRGVLNQFASDALGALWELDAPYREAGESAEKTITNLGAYVRHVHMIDSRVEDGKIVNCLMGEGDMPMKDVFGALRSINYDGFCSFEWLPGWMPELDDAEIIFPHYVNYMTVFEARSRRSLHRYTNKAGTGRYVWKKEALIEMTFPQVLDRMVEEFPDQYAFRFTTLDYTRTYAEFRDDVDEFARSLIALGVKPGDKVAMWATNVPQWYIGFWATT